MIKRFINWVDTNSIALLNGVTAISIVLILVLLCVMARRGAVSDAKFKAKREQTEAKFKQDHGNLAQVIYCRDGFLIKERVVSGDVEQQVIMNEAGYPTRCGSVTSITVKETAKTGLLVGDTN